MTGAERKIVDEVIADLGASRPIYALAKLMCLVHADDERKRLAPLNRAISRMGRRYRRK